MPRLSLKLKSAPALLALLICGGTTALAQQPDAAPQPDAPAQVETASAADISTAAEAAARLAAARGFKTEEESGRRQQQQDPQPTPTPTNSGQAGGAPPRTPLTGEEKVNRAFRRAFLSPAPYAITAFSTTLTQLGEDELPDKDFEDEFGDWASRFARSFATRTTRTLFTNGFYPALFRQDPRYDRLGRGGFMRRAGHAVGRVFVTLDDDGNVEPNVSRLGGTVTASALANLWERSTPGHDRIGTDATLRRIARYYINDALTNIVFREFWPDIMKIFGR